MAKSYAEREKEAEVYYKAGLQRVKSNPMPKGQKFPPSSFVKIAKNLGSAMSHFKSNVYAQVEYTYAHMFGGRDIYNYSLVIRDLENTWYECAWYHECQLSQVEDKRIIKILQKEINKRRSNNEMV